METMTSPLTAWKTSVSGALGSLANNLPAIVAAILIVIVGWLVARLARAAVRHLFAGIERLLDRSLRHGSMSASRVSRPLVAVAGEIVFWTVLFLTVTAATRVAGLALVTSWLNELVVYLPNLVAGLAIIVGGFVASVYLREWIVSIANRHGVEPADAAGRLIQGLVLVVALVVGLDQLGIDVVILIVAFAVIGGALLSGLMIAFALGAREHVGNLVGARHARSVLTPGLRVRIAGIEGKVLDVSATHINIDVAEGRLLLPAHMADTSQILILTRHGDTGTTHGQS